MCNCTSTLPGTGSDRISGGYDAAQASLLLTAREEAMRDAAKAACSAKSGPIERMPIMRSELEERRYVLQRERARLTEKLALLDTLINLFR